MDHSAGYPSTLVQSSEGKNFLISRRTVEGTKILIVTFPRGLTILMNANNVNRPRCPGEATIEVHRRFITREAKWLHYVRILFIHGRQIQAQILLPSRLSAALELIKGGHCGCFLQNPLRPLRQSRNLRRRTPYLQPEI